MRFSLNLMNIIPKMGDEYDTEIQDIDSTNDLAWEIVKMLLRGELEFEVDDDGFLVLDVPDWLLEEYGYPLEEGRS